MALIVETAACSNLASMVVRISAEAPSPFDIKTRSTATAARCRRITNNFELAPYQLHGIVYFTPFQ